MKNAHFLAPIPMTPGYYVYCGFPSASLACLLTHPWVTSLTAGHTPVTTLLLYMGHESTKIPIYPAPELFAPKTIPGTPWSYPENFDAIPKPIPML